MHWELTGSVGTQGPAGYWWHQGAPMGCRVSGDIGAIRECQGCIGGWQGVQVLGASRGIGGIRGS